MMSANGSYEKTVVEHLASATFESHLVTESSTLQ
jgi:hypothetical protein